MLRSVTETEPEWDDTERAWAIALLEVEADTCGGCGQPLSETTRSEAEDGYQSGLPMVCHGCKAVHRRQRQYAGDEDPASLMFTVRRVWKEPPGGR